MDLSLMCIRDTEHGVRRWDQDQPRKVQINSCKQVKKLGQDEFALTHVT